MNKEQALEYINKIDALPHSTEEHQIDGVLSYLACNAGDTLESIEQSGYFCIECPRELVVETFVVQHGDYYYDFNSDNKEEELWGERSRIEGTQGQALKDYVKLVL